MANNLDHAGRRLHILAAAAAALAGFVFYLVTSFTGYLAQSTVNPIPVICSVAALVLLCACWFAGKSLSPLLRDLLTVAAGVLLIVNFVFFALSRVSLAADVYFIPVNYPKAEETALYLSLVGIALYLVSIITMIVEALSAKE